MTKAILKYLILLTIIFLIENNCKGQDIHFSQFSEAPLLRNPALAGIFTGDLRFQAVYRNQWNSVTSPYQTTSLNGEFKMPVGNKDDFLTIGGQILYDKAGTIALSATHILPVLNFHKSLSSERNMYLSAGFLGGIVQRKLDRSRITTNSQYNGSGYDPTLGNGETFPNNNYLYFDGSAGLSFNMQIGQNPDNNFFVGAAYHHFNKSAKVSFYSQSDIALFPKMVFSAGVKTSVNDDAYVTFQGDFSKQGPSSEIIGGMIYSLKLDDSQNPHYIISAGGFLRWKDAFIPIIKMEIMPLAFALSYDVNVSSLKAASQSRGGFELSLSYQKYFNYNSSIEAVRCPKF